MSGQTRGQMSGDRIRRTAAITLACLLMLAMQGYQFGKSNHTVYLVDALRHVHPDLLANDWFTTRTLQYHAAFGWLTRALLRAGIAQPAFLGGYLALLVLLHLAWWRIVRLLGGGIAAFILSVLLFQLSACGTGLGLYQFLQDSAFLPSNIAAVAMLWGIYFAAANRLHWAAAMMGISGLFHLNYAVVAPCAWIVAWLASAREQGQRRPRLNFGQLIWAIAMVEMCLMNAAPAAILMATRGGTPLPLREFIELYVRLRHPHHYDPSTWPTALWVGFLWPIPFALIVLPRQRVLSNVFWFFSVLIIIALLGAGIWYVSETLIQLSLWRFSVFVKLFSCIAAAVWLCERVRRPRLIVTGSALAGAAIIAACALRGPYLGLFRIPEDDAKYLSACDWIRRHTPREAVFLVPPGELAFRLRAARAIVVNFKGVPQLASELGEWRDRLENVLMSPDLQDFHVNFERTLAAMNHRYESLPPGHYLDIARRYKARFVLVDHRLGSDWEPRRIDLDGNTSWFLYDLAK